MKMTCSKWLLYVGLIMISTGVTADPNKLLGDAIKNAHLINENTPTEQRLELYSEIFTILDEIVAKYPSSEQAIKILSNQPVGNFNPKILRTTYIKELTGYYDTVCEVSPNYACLGFVSLSTGQNRCSAASTAKDVVEAHQNLKNSAKVFIGQQEDGAYVSLALNEYRNCLANSQFKASSYSKDFFASDLVTLLLQSKREGTAKAIIEKMQTPAFKVSGVLALSKSQEKPFDRKFYERLKKYITEKVADKNGNRTIAALKLTEDAFSRGNIKINSGDVRWGFRTGGNFGIYARQCDPFFVRSVIDSVVDLQLNIVTLDKKRRGYYKAEIPNLMNQVSDELSSVLNACKDSKTDTKEFALSAKLHGQILLLSKIKAAEFREGILERDWSAAEQIGFAIRVLGTNQKLFEAEYGLIKNVRGSELVEFTSMLKSDRALLPVFKQFVDYGNVCEASKLLFQKMKGRHYYDDAIEYMVDSDRIDMKVKHNCGDSALELMLN